MIERIPPYDWEIVFDLERSEREYWAEYGPPWVYVKKRKVAIYKEHRKEIGVFWGLVDYVLQRLFPLYHDRLHGIHVSLPPMRIYVKSKGPASEEE